MVSVSMISFLLKANSRLGFLVQLFVRVFVVVENEKSAPVGWRISGRVGGTSTLRGQGVARRHVPVSQRSVSIASGLSGETPSADLRNWS